jgi:hypothetical protein
MLWERLNSYHYASMFVLCVVRGAAYIANSIIYILHTVMTVFCSTHTRWRKGQASVFQCLIPGTFAFGNDVILLGPMLRLENANKMDVKRNGIPSELNCTCVGRRVMVMSRCNGTTSPIVFLITYLYFNFLMSVLFIV